MKPSNILNMFQEKKKCKSITKQSIRLNTFHMFIKINTLITYQQKDIKKESSIFHKFTKINISNTYLRKDSKKEWNIKQLREKLNIPLKQNNMFNNLLQPQLNMSKMFRNNIHKLLSKYNIRNNIHMLLSKYNMSRSQCNMEDTKIMEDTKLMEDTEIMGDTKDLLNISICHKTHKM